MNKQELVQPLFIGQKLTKADAGRDLDSHAPKPKKTTRESQSPAVNPKAALSTIAALWNRITPAEQETFNSGAVGFPAKNKYGDIYTPSGYQVFMKLNLNLYTCNAPLVTSCPIPDFPILPLINHISFNTPEQLLFEISGGIPTNMYIQILASTQVLIGSNPRKGKEKFLGIAGKLTKADAGRDLDKAVEELDQMYSLPMSVLDITGVFQNLFGLVKSKAQLFIKFVPISAVTGQAGVPYIANVQIPEFTKQPKIKKFVGGVFLQNVPVDKTWIHPFRIDAFNLTEKMVVSVPLDPADRWRISTSEAGPWVLSIDVPLNEMNQPSVNVFFARLQVVAPSLIGFIVTAESVGAPSIILGFGANVVDQSINPLPNPRNFGDVYTVVPEVFEVSFPYIALRRNIEFSVSGVNASNFLLSRSPLGPWFPNLTYLIDATGTNPDASIFVQVTGEAVGAIFADINYNAGGDIIATLPVSANDIDAILTSPNSPGDSFGANAIGMPIVWDFAVQGQGLATNAGIFTSALVNCTVEYGPSAVGPWAPLSQAVKIGSTLPLTQIFFKAVPTAIGVFSWSTDIQAANSNLVSLAYDGVGI